MLLEADGVDRADLEKINIYLRKFDVSQHDLPPTTTEDGLMRMSDLIEEVISTADLPDRCTMWLVRSIVKKMMLRC
jgi:hypothetical protein